MDLIETAVLGTIEDVKRVVRAQKEKLNNAFARAATNGKVEIAEYLLDQGADIHHESGWALSGASNAGYLEMVKLLLTRGANLHEFSHAALQCAVRSNQLDIVGCMLKHYSGPGRAASLQDNFDHQVPGENSYVCNGRLFSYPIAVCIYNSFNSGTAKMARLFLEDGANIHFKNNYALRRAMERKESDLINLFHCWSAYKEFPLCLEKVRRCVRMCGDLFDYLSPAAGDTEKIISIYVAGIDLSKQTGFNEHVSWLKKYVDNVLLELTDVGLISVLGKLVLSYL